MKKKLFAAFAILFLSGCAAPSKTKSDSQGPDAVAKLNQLLPDLRKNVLPYGLAVADVLAGVDSSFANVKAYGRSLINHPAGNADSITVHADLYWSAFTTMVMKDPSVYLTRVCLLIGEGRLARARYVLYFTDLHSEQGKGDNAQALRSLETDIASVVRASDAMVEMGIKEFDAGDKEKAKAFYRAALDIYPKNPRATYEMGLTLLTTNLEAGRIEAEDHAALFAQTRSYDPFYAFAYQGPKTLSLKMAIVISEIEPSLKALYGNRPSAADFGRFADACMKLDEWELAAYAYHFKLFMTLDPDTGFDGATADRFAECIRNLGATKAAEEVRGQMRKYNTLLAESRKKKK